MERRKTEAPSAKRGKRGRKSREEVAEEVRSGIRPEEPEVNRSVVGPSSHLPKCRVVERYLMSILIKEFEHDTGLTFKASTKVPK